MPSELEILKSVQNSDGGWGYFPGKKSWLEPTAYAMLALHGQPQAERAWMLVRSWQLPSGAWKPCAEVAEPNWASALAITLHCVRGVKDEHFRRGVDWIIGSTGAEGGFLNRMRDRIFTQSVDQDHSLSGWPWRSGNASWVEPTAHSLVALRKAAAFGPNSKLNARIDLAQKMLLNRRCRDGGWNYGNKRVLDVDLESYPELTALAVLGLQGTSAVTSRAVSFWPTPVSPLARAWLTIALRLHGVLPDTPAPQEPAASAGDLMLTALQAIGATGGTWPLLKTERT
jgi:hypothetical protein